MAGLGSRDTFQSRSPNSCYPAYHTTIVLSAIDGLLDALRPIPCTMLHTLLIPSPLADLRKQTGPARDNLPTAPPDSGPPTTPTGLTMAQGHLGPNSIMLRWTLASDDRAVGGYTLQLVRTLPTDTGATGAALFAPSVIAQPINAELARFNNAWLGNTEGALLEALATGYRYYARLAARDLAGKLSQWSEPVSLLLANSGTQSRSGVKP